MEITGLLWLEGDICLGEKLQPPSKDSARFGRPAYRRLHLAMEVREPDDDQAVLGKQLSRDVDALKGLNHQPVYITSFFKGHSEPTEYKRMLNALKHSAHLKIWVQDGVGTKTLLPAEIALYLQDLASCSDSPLAGLVYEIFRQVGPDHQFKAETLPARQLASALLQRAPCRGDSIFFSLRYLINFGH
jgi:hypothetical protein